MTTTNSPRTGPAARRARCSAGDATTVSSNCLVSSRATRTGVSPKTSPRAVSVATMRCGDSKTTTVVSSSRSARRRLRRRPGFTGRNPSNTTRSAGMPATERAAVSAEAPGTGTTVTPAALASRTSMKPGSESAGVPASVTRATDRPASSWRSSSGPRRAMLCAKYDVVGVWMSKWASRARVRRVSSQAMTSTSRSTRSARSVTSSRLPMGVATTKRVPLRLRRLLLGRFRDQEGPLAVHDDLARDHALLETLDGRQLVHDLEHDLFQDGAQAAGAGAPLERLARDGGHRVVGELEPDL